MVTRLHNAAPKMDRVDVIISHINTLYIVKFNKVKLDISVF